MSALQSPVPTTSEKCELLPSVIPPGFVDADEALEHEQTHRRDQRGQADDQPQRPRVARSGGPANAARLQSHCNPTAHCE